MAMLSITGVTAARGLPFYADMAARALENSVFDLRRVVSRASCSVLTGLLSSLKDAHTSSRTSYDVDRTEWKAAWAALMPDQPKTKPLLLP